MHAPLICRRSFLLIKQGLSDIRTAAGKVLTMILRPLEAKSMCAAVIQDEVEDICKKIHLNWNRQ